MAVWEGGHGVQVRVRLFGTYREVAGRREFTVELAEGATLQALLEILRGDFPALERHEDAMLLAVNQEFANPQVPLRDGDEVALMPPVSGGSEGVDLADGPIDAAACLASVRTTAAGAVVLFLGAVRADPGVAALDYEAYDAMAVKKLRELRTAAIQRFGLAAMTIVHRRGRVPLGEDAVAIAASAPHRQEAFAAAAWAMDEVKKIVPIWKSEG